MTQPACLIVSTAWNGDIHRFLRNRRSRHYSYAVLETSQKWYWCQKVIAHSFSIKAECIQNGIRIQTLLHHLHLYFITRGLFVTLTEVARVILYEMQAVSLHWSAFYPLSLIKCSIPSSSRLPLQFVSCKLYVNTMCENFCFDAIWYLFNSQISVSGHVTNLLIEYSLVLIMCRNRLNARTSLRIQMDADAMDASKCMPPICFEDCRANQPDVVRSILYTLTFAWSFSLRHYP